MIHSKKSQLHHAFSAGYFVMAGFILVVMAFVLILTIGSYLSSFTVTDKDLPTHIYAYRAINTCLAYQDQVTKRFYPGIIDMNKYTQQNLEACYSDTSVKSFNVQLKDLDKGEAQSRLLVGFGASLYIKSYPVWIRYPDGNISSGELLFGASQ
jgi:hypothetical protein